MEGLASKRGAVRVMVVALMIIMGWQTCAVARLIRVGGSRGWQQNVNYTDWSRHESFYVGDWLDFIFDKHTYNVLEVNKTSYENCNDQGFIQNITRGGRDVFQLTEARPYYFLSSGGYCYQGMKVAVPVEAPVPTQAPEPAKNGSPSNKPSRIFLSIPISMIFVLSILLNKS
ncbi:Lamin-like protein [Morella rubra]|uniref:Lamin-like protein n=1 Tax=Morella rubra TaxID=262757 RepID=A0A6A1VFJ0_9ROSI|nr:Lamin-like protein [Morella rubra]